MERTDLNLSEGFRLGEVTVIPARNIVIAGDHEVHLEPKIMDVCLFLAERGGEVVSRDKLIESMWNARFGSDESLTRAIYILRKAFSQSRSKNIVIETVPKKGYRLTVSARPLTPSSVREAQAPTKSEATFSVAVLAFEDMSADGDQEYFSDGIAEEIINALVPLPVLRVIGRTSSFSFKGKSSSISEIAEALNVSHILEGSVRKHGDALRITAQFVDATEDRHLWSKTFDGSVADVFDLQDQIAQAVSQELELLLELDDPSLRLAETLTANAEAYDLFLQGRALNARIFGDGVLERAAEFLERAVALDLLFAEAWAELANAYVQMASYLQIDDRLAILQKAYPAAQKAIDLKPGHGFARSIQSWIPITQGDMLGSLKLAQEAHRLEPNNPNVVMRLGYYFAVIGRTGEAISLLRKAVELDPIQGRNHATLSMTLINAGDIEGGEYHSKRAIDLQYMAAPLAHQTSAYAAGNNELAIKRCVDGVRSSLHSSFSADQSTPEFWTMVATTAYTGTSDQQAILVKGMCASVTDPNKRKEVTFLFMLLLCGAVSEFFDSFGSCATPGNHVILVDLWNDLASMKQVREHPEFIDFAKRIGMVAAWEAYGYPDRWDEISED